MVIAACGCPKGGSALIMKALSEEGFVGIVSPVVIRECEKNIRKKMSEEEILRFYKYLGKIEFKVQKVTGQLKDKKIIKAFPKKEYHIIEGVIKSKADILLTLDRKNFFNPEVKKLELPFSIMTPKKFIKKYFK